MKCRYCGKENPEGYKFCGYCGKDHSSCPKCGKDVPPDMQYCGHCGMNINRSGNVAIQPTDHNPFRGKICPFCQAPFKNETKVVLCKACGMPHHRDCWTENGHKCTTFGCNGKEHMTEKSSIQQSNEPRIPNHQVRQTQQPGQRVGVFKCPNCDTINRVPPERINNVVSCYICNNKLALSPRQTQETHEDRHNDGIAVLASIMLILVLIGFLTR